MKKYLLKILAVTALLHGLAWTSAERQQPTLTDFVAVFSVDHAQKLPQSWASAPIKNLIVTPKVVQFTLRDIPFKIEFIGEKSRYLRLNGHIFSERNLHNIPEFTRAFYAKFGIYRKRSTASLVTDDVFETGLDDATTAGSDVDEASAEADEEAEEGDGRPRFRFESQENSGFVSYFANAADRQIFGEGSLLANTEAGRRMQMAVDMMAGPDAAGMVTATALSMMALQYNVNSALGRPLNQELTDIGPRPSTIPFPQFN